MRLRRRTSAFATSVAVLRRRFRCGLFLVRMWDLNARIRLSFPEPVLRIRLAAPRFDFILGTS